MHAAARAVRPPSRPPSTSGVRRAADVAVVACGGALGTAARDLLGRVMPDDPVAVAVVIADVAGALALGLLAGRIAGRRTGLFWRTGVLGSFTTFSAVAVQAVDLGPLLGVAYLVGLVGVGLAAAAAGTRWRHQEIPGG